MAVERISSPPYVSYTYFKASLRELPHDGKLPPKLDNSVLSKMNGSTRSQFLIAARFLGLVDENNAPTAAGHELAASNDAEWKIRLSNLLLAKLPTQLEQLKSGTANTFKQSFEPIASGSLVVPAARFLFLAAKDVGLPISKHITEIQGGRKVAKQRSESSRNGASVDNPPLSVTHAPHGAAPSFQDRMLEKFPAFDPSWTPEQQASWFATYQKLLELSQKGPPA